MAGFVGIAAAGKSIERLLNQFFTAPPPEQVPVPGRLTRAFLARTEDFVKSGSLPSFPTPALSIFTYRVDFNKTMRASWSAVGHADGRGHLPLDIHFLITAWADNAEHEQRILGAAMECLESNPILSGPLLHPDPLADWAPGESMQIVMEELSTEAVMRTFDSLPTEYKLSVPYIARIVRLTSRQPIVTPDVTEIVTGARSTPR
jgi:hypothetical protein